MFDCTNDIDKCGCDFCAEARWGRLKRAWYSQDVFEYASGGSTQQANPAQANPAQPKVEERVNVPRSVKVEMLSQDDDLPF